MKNIIKTIAALSLATGLSILSCKDPRPSGFISIICWAMGAGMELQEYFDDYDIYYDEEE